MHIGRIRVLMSPFALFRNPEYGDQAIARRALGSRASEGRASPRDSLQLTLDMAKTHGGRRVGAGRPKTLSRPNVRHETPAPRAGWIPAHVTLRGIPSLPDFRLDVMHSTIVGCIRDSQREAFRIVQYSIQQDHLHLIVEASGETLGRGMRGFSTRTARRLNRAAERTGRVWADRYHRHDLRTPREVRNALVYVLGNGAKHGVVPVGTIDPCSSARFFDGWATPPPGLAANDDAEVRPVRPAESWLLRVGWLKVWPGYVLFTETPKTARLE